MRGAGRGWTNVPIRGEEGGGLVNIVLCANRSPTICSDPVMLFSEKNYY